MQYEDFDKWLIRQDRLRRDLSFQRHSLGWMPLEPPVQKGWKRGFVLREDVARSDKAAFYEGILQKINCWEWSYRKDFKIKKREKGRKKYVEKVQWLRVVWPSAFEKKQFSDAEQREFLPELHFSEYDNRPYLIYVFKEPWRFVLKVFPNMVDKIRVIDPDLETRIAEVDHYIERNDYEKRLRKVLRGYYGWRRDMGYCRYIENPLRNKPIHRILEELNNEL
jgi:hypothetical protein